MTITVNNATAAKFNYFNFQFKSDTIGKENSQSAVKYQQHIVLQLVFVHA